MTPQELELWAREIVATVLSKQPVEDSTVELKANWIEPEKAAERLAGHANASRGASILWLIGVDERNSSLTNVDPIEKENWYKAVQKYFDGFAPRLQLDVNIRIQNSIVVALYFDTAHESPYVVRNTKSGGNYPEYVVPWREGTRLRSARRDELLRILIPIRRLSVLLDELEFNIYVAKSAKAGPYDAWGTPFREQEFHQAMRDGAISTLPNTVKQLVINSYVVTGRANQRVFGALNRTLMPGEDHNRAREVVMNSLGQLESAYHALVNYLRGSEA